ncbi:Ca2+-binding RTX toxin-like protein [Marinobacterium sp. MBR-111]|uniref:hypothetical protein n=1 Tax=Marinobacterium sp. MBR-111 TaxID=3156463 RepID=UPI00339937C9
MDLTATEKLVHQMYIAYYQRPADPQGLHYWVEQLEKYNDWTVVSAAFGSPENLENQGLYGGKSRQEVIAEIYQSAFNRAAVQEEIDYWASSEHSLTDLAFAIVNGAQNDDLATINAKLAFSAELVDIVDPQGNGVPAEYAMPFAFDVIGLLKNVDKNDNVDTQYVLDAIATDEVPLPTPEVFTVRENFDQSTTDAITTEIDPIITRVTYWGESGQSEGESAGVPVADLIALVESYLGLTVVPESAVDSTNDIVDITLQPVESAAGTDGEEAGAETDADEPVSYEFVVTFADGTQNTNIVDLRAQEFEFISELLFDENGDSRLFEVELKSWPQIILRDQSGEPVLDANGNPVLIDLKSYTADGITSVSKVPLVLTTVQNNGSTDQEGVTSAAVDNRILVDRLELLHDATIDGGEGSRNTLEVDAKGAYARPNLVENVQLVQIQNLPNIYGADNANDPVRTDAGSDTPSVIDLTRVLDIEQLVITEGYDNGTDLGDLFVLGVRNGALLALEGSFTEAVTVHYGEGISPAGLNLQLNLGDTHNENFDLKVSHNSATLNVEAVGAENWIHDADLGGQLRFLNVTGEGSLTIEGNIAQSFIDTRPATIDATQAGGGVDLTFDGQPVVVFNGSQAGDEFAATNADRVTIAGGNGANHFVTDGSANVVITSGEGHDVISSTGGEEVSIEAGAGDNQIDTTGSAEVEITALDGDNEVVANGVTDLSLTLGNGDNSVNADNAQAVNMQLGDGSNSVSVLGAQTLDITLGDGGNTLTASGATINLVSGAGNDNVTLAAAETEALLNVNLGSGSDRLTLGNESAGIVALDESAISGENIRLTVANDTDLSRASLEGINNVVLKGELTLTADQAAALGADAFSVYRESFGETQNLHIIVTEDVVLSELFDMSQLSDNVRLNFDLRNGAELTLTAQELHEHVAWQGIDSSDGLNGSVQITNAGGAFDPFDAGQDYQVVDGGSLTGNFDASTDVHISYGIPGYNRPEPQPSTAVLTIDSDLVPVVEDIYDGIEDGTLEHLAKTLKITGGQDITFETAIDLHDSGYSVDFADFQHNVIGMTLADFQDVLKVEGNGDESREVRIDVKVSGEDAVVGEAGGLHSSGVQTYIVTDVNDGDSSYSDHEEVTFHFSDNSQDLHTLGLQGNFNATLNLLQVHWGVSLLLEGDGKVFNNLQSAGHPAFSNIGTVNVEYAYDAAPVVIDINNQGVATSRPLNVAELNIANARSITFNIEDADAVIGSINNATDAGEFLDGKSDEVRELIFVSANDVTVKGRISVGELETLNASAVDGDFTLQLSGENDLSGVAVTGLDAIMLTDSQTVLTISNELLQQIGEAAVTGQGTLNVIIADQPFDSSALGSELTVNLVSKAGEWTLDSAADLSEVDQFTVGEGSVLTMTADQALQLADTPVVNGGEGAQINITGATQAHVDAGLESLLTTLAAAGLEGRLGLAEDLTLTATTLNAAATGGFTLVGEVAGLRVDVVMDEANAEAGVNMIGTDPVNGVQSEGVAVFVVTQLDASADDILYVCNDTEGLEVLGLQGNGGDSLTVGGIKRGVTFLLEGDGAADWSEVEKEDLTPDFSSIGAFNATYFTPGATAQVEINNQGVELAGASDGGERAIKVDGITINNATTIAINVADGDAIISGLDGDSVETLNLTTTEDLTIEGVLPETLSSIDASAVTGLFSATLEAMDGAFTLTTGADAQVAMNGLVAAAGSTIDGSAGSLTLTVTDTDLSAATLSGVDAVAITEGSELTLSADQVLDVTPAAINGSVAGTGNAHEVLNVVGLSDQLIDVNALGTDVVLGTVSLASGTYTLDPAADLSGATVLIPADAEVTMSADQYMALASIDGITQGATLNITGLTQAHVDAGFNLAGVDNAIGSVALAEDVRLLTSTDLNGFSVVMSDDQTLGLATRAQADGLAVSGGNNTTLVYMFASGWNAIDDTIDGSGYDVDELHLLSALVSQHDVELIQNLASDVTVVVFNDPSMLAFAEATYRSVVIETGVTVDDWIVFNDYQVDREVAVLDLTLRGDAGIDGNLRLTTVVPEDSNDPDNVNDSLYNHLQSLVITSEGELPNHISGDIDPTVSVVNTVNGVTNTENNLLNVIINATADFTVGGKIRFNAIGDDVAGTNDDETAVLSVNVAAGQSVVLNDLDTDDEDVTGLTVNHTGDGALTFGLSTVATVDADDQFTINGSATGTTTIVIDTWNDEAGTAGPALDLSDDTLSNVDAIVLEDQSELTLSHAQIQAMGGLEAITTASLGESATLNLVALGTDPFDASTATNGIELATVTILDNNATVTLNAATDLTGVGSLVVPAGTTLELTAAQFQQLQGAGTITGAGAVNITDVTQADLEGGLDLSLVSATNGTITFAEDVLFGVDDNLAGFTLELADGQMVTLSSQAQADGREVNGTGATSTLVLGFELLDTATPDTELDASGYGVTDLFVMDRLVEYYNGQNLETLLQDLSSTVDVTIFDITNAPSEIAPGAMTTDRTVTIQSGATVDTQIVFNDLDDDVEVSTLDLTLGGGATIDGNLDLSTVTPAPGTVTLNYFQTLTIRSEGDSPNRIVDAIHANGSTAGYAENNLRDVNIVASQDLTIGEIEFSSLQDNRTAELNVSVESGATVTIGDLDTDDDDIDALTVNHTGDGDLTVGLSTVATVDASDLITINGSATGETTLVIDTYDEATGTAGAPFDLSDDVLVNVDAIVLTDGSELTLTMAQLNSIGGLQNLTVESNGDNAAVNILGLDNQPFDASEATAGIDIVDVTIGGSGNAVTLAAITDLTGIDRLIVPEGKTLSLTAEQFQQLAGSGTIVGQSGTGFTVNITGLTQADVDLDGGFDITGIAADNITLTLAEDVNLDDASMLGDLSKLEVYLATNQDLGLANAAQADGLTVSGPSDSTVVFMFDDVSKGYVDYIDASGYNIDTLKALNTFVDGRNIEQILQDLDNDIILSLYHSPEDLGFVSATHRILVVEPGVTVPDFIVVNDLDGSQEVRTLAITLQGGAEIDGNLHLSTVEADSGLIARYFLTLSILSTGTAANTETGNTYNLINGDITAQAGPDAGTIENNLRDVVIIAEQDIVVSGDIVFSSVDAAKYPSATLTITNEADVTIQQLDLSDDELTTFTINHQGTGTLTATGASPALFDGDADGAYTTDTTGNLETLNIKGTGNIELGNDEGGWGITASGLSTINAATHTGDLNLGEIRDIDSSDFTFTSGTGETYLKLAGDTLNAGAEDAGWTFDFASADSGTGAAANSVIELGDMTWTSGTLNIYLGANTQLLISADTDLSDLDLTLTGSGANQIVVADGVTLTLTAAQLDAIQTAGLNIVGETGTAADTGVVDIVDLGTDSYDLTAVQTELFGTATLAENDVTLDATTLLGGFSITLDALSGDNDDLSGQTIRFQTEAQAAREIIVNAPDGDTDNTNSSNVVWLFETLADYSSPVNTDDYAEGLGRLWVTQSLILAAGGDVEDLYTSLPDSIVRSDFSDVEALEVLLLSSEVHRTMEFVAFTDLNPDDDGSGLVISDIDDLEHVKTLELNLGGEVNLGVLTIGNETVGTGIDLDAIRFETLTINSHRALHTDSLLAPEVLVNNNNGVDEAGEYEQPENHNTIDSISAIPSGTGTPVYSLRNVVLDTGEVSVVGDGSLGAGADLRIDTIVFNAEGTDKSVNLTVNGENTVTVDVLDLSDDSLADVDGHVTFNISGDGNLVVDDVLDSGLGQILLGSDTTATSAEINTALTSDASIKGITLGDNVTSFIVNNTGAGDLNVTGGSPALQGESLRNLGINAESGDVTLGGADTGGAMGEGYFYGVLAEDNGDPSENTLVSIETTGSYDAVVYVDALADGFTYTHGAGNDSQIWVDATIGTGDTWTFNLDGVAAGNGATLYLTPTITQASNLIINAGIDGDVHIWGENSEVDLTNLVQLEINGTEVGVHLDSGMRLLMTDQQFYGKDGEPKFDLLFTGPGQTLRTDNSDDLTEVRGLSDIIIPMGATVTLTPEQAAIARVGENGTVGDLRDATVTVQFSPYQTTLDASVVGVDTLEIVGEQTDLNYLDAYDDDFRVSLTAAQVDGLTTYTNSVNVTGQVFVDVYNLGDDEVDLSIIPDTDAGVITLASDSVTLDPDTDLGDAAGFEIDVEDNSLTLTAAQADGRTIYDNGSDGTTSAGAGTVIITGLEATLAADLSGIIAGDEQAQLDVNGATVIFVGDLGRDMTVTVTNSDDLTGGTLIFDSSDGSMISARTEFVLTEGDDITFQLDANDAHELTVTGNDNTVEVNNLDGDETDLTGFSVTTGGSLTATVPEFGGDVTLNPATQLGDFDVVVEGDTVLTLDFTQFADHGAGKFSGTQVYDNSDPLNVTGSQLAITGYDGSQALASDDLGDDLVISTLTVADDAGDVVTAHPDSDFSNVDEIVIPAGVTLNMTADQFQQIMTSTTVVGDGTLNITGFGSDPAHLNINLSSVEAQAGTITLDPNVSSVVLKSTAILDGTASSGDTAFSFVYTADGQALVLSSEIQADGRGVNGGTFDDTILALGFTSADDVDSAGDPETDANIEAGGFNVENVWLVSEYLYNEFSLSNLPANIETILPNLPGNAGNGDPLVVTLKPASELLDGFGDPDAIDTADRVVVVSDNHDVDASVVFNDLTAREISSLTLTLEGDSTITGNLALPQNKDPLQTLETTDKLPALFKSLVINSVDVTGTATGPNEIRGSIFADDGTDGLESTAETFELTVASMIVSGTGESIAFDGAFIALDDGDTEADIAAKLAAATYDNWVAEVTSPGVVRFTYKIPGDFTENTSNDLNLVLPTVEQPVAPATGDIANINVSSGLISGNFTLETSDTNPSFAGAHRAEENNLYNITINAEHDLIISGELELSYVTRSNTLKDETVEGTITITGDADVTIGSVNTDDIHITGVTLNHTGTGTVNAPGTSPGAALGNTETLTINTMGNVVLGTEGDASKPGVSGSELSAINVNTDGSSNGTVDLGVIGELDGDNFSLNVGAGTVHAELGWEGPAEEARYPALNNSGVWTFNGAGGDLQLTINDIVEFPSAPDEDSELNLIDVTLTISGDVNLSTVGTVTGLDNVTIPAGSSLTLTAEQASGATISGEGTLNIVGDLPADYDFSGLAVEYMDFSGVSGVTGDTGVKLDLSAHTGIDFKIIGTNADDDITGSDGNDIIDGGAGNDILDGGAGADIIYGGEDNDTIVYDESDLGVDGGSGSDTLTAADWDNSLDGTTGVIIDLTDTTDAFTSFENVIGSAYNDFVFGDATVESIETGAGFDIISMGEYLDANVVINGGAGQDVLAFEYNIGTSAADLLNQVSGVETLLLSAANTGDVNITVGNDTLVAANETLVINAGSLTAQQRLVFDGRAETDGDFDITGGAGNDIIIGGNQPNSDVITGGAGNDILTGAAGNDTFNVDQGSDIITDLSESDILVVSPDASATAYVTGDWTATAATENNGTGPVELILGQVDPLTGNVTDADAYEKSGFTINLDSVTNGTSGFNLTTSGTDLNFTLIGSAFDDTLTVTNTAALNANASLGDFAVTLASSVQLTLSYDQLTETGLGNFQGTGTGTTEETLVVTGYNGEAFDSTELGSQMLIAELQLAAEGTVLQPTTITIDPTADLSKVQEIVIPEHVTLNMTAAQYQSLIGPATKISGAGTLNITEMSSEHSDINLGLVEAGVIAGTITLAATETNVLFDSTAVLNAAGGTGSPFSIDFSADGQNVTLSTETQADGRVVNGGTFTDSTLTLGFTNADATDSNANIAAVGFDVENVWILNEYLYNEFGLTNKPANFEAILDSLRDQASNGETLVVTVKDAATLLLDGTADPDALNTTDRVVVIDENVTLDASTAFEDVTGAGEVSTLSLTLEGNSVITGNLELPQSNDPLDTLTDDGKLPGLFKALVINSVDVTGTATAPNEIRGDIFADNGTDDVNSESRAETFALRIGGSGFTSPIDANQSIAFDGALIALSAGDTAADVAEKLANASYDNWTATVDGVGDVIFTYKIAGEYTGSAPAIVSNDPAPGAHEINLSAGLTGGDFVFVPGKAVTGIHNANENNLYNITINADHDLVISGELELSYVTRSNALKDETVAATITINGDGDVTIGSVNSDDEHISGVTLIHNGTGTVTAPGTSPGAALGNTETLTINTMGTVVLGTAGDDDKPGVAGADLSVININTDGVSNGTVNLGVIALIDSDDFTLNAGAGAVIATLGVDTGSDGADSQGGPELDGGTWTFNGTNDNIQLTINDEAIFTSGTLVLDNVELTIDGDVDFSNITVVGLGNLYDIPAGQSLTLTAAQADGLTVTGEGTLKVVGDELDAHDFSNLQVKYIDFSGLDTAESDDVTLNLSAHNGIDFVVTGSDFADTITTADGDDTIYGGLGDDVIDGGAGADIIYGGEDDDTIIYDPNDLVVNADGPNEAGGSSSTGGSSDTLDASGFGEGVTFNFDASMFQNFENFIGTDFDDEVTAGVDEANGIFTGAGNDIIEMGVQLTSADTIDGGDGSDELRFTYAHGADETDDDLNGVTNIERITLGDALTMIETVDTLVAAGETLVVDGSALRGTNNMLFDGLAETDGQFEIIGGTGEDILAGGALNDVLTGNGGDDAFYVRSGTDTITDLSGADSVKVDAGATAEATVTADFTATSNTENNGTANLSVEDDVDVNLSSATGNNGFNVDASGNTAASTLIGSAQADVLTGGEGDDILTGGSGGDTFNITAGTDTVTDLSGSDVLVVSEDATVNATVTADYVATAETQNDGTANLTVNEDVDVNLSAVTNGSEGFRISAEGNTAGSILIGSAFDDYIIGGDGSDNLSGGAGDDTFSYDVGASVSIVADQVDGGDGTDTLFAWEGNGGSITLEDSDFANVSNMEVLELSAGVAASVTLGTEANKAFANGIDITNLLEDGVLNVDGTDATVAITATGGNANDFLTGGSAADTLIGGAGDDIIDGKGGADTINAGEGNDTVHYDADDLSVDGGDGIDTLTAINAVSAVTIDLSDTTDAFVNFENLVGSSYGDTLTGDAGANEIWGGDGDDLIDGGAGADIIDAGYGDDTVIYDAADVWVDGGAGSDTIDASAETADLYIDLDDSNDIFTNFENIIGGAGNDTLIGTNTATSTLDGGAGDDILTGHGSVYDSVFYVGEGHDRITDLQGNDGLYVSGNASVTASVVADFNGAWTEHYSTGVVTLNVAYTNATIDMTDSEGAGFTINAGVGTDTLTGSAADDIFNFGTNLTGTDTVNGGAGSDELTFTDNNGTADDLDGVTNVERVTLGDATTVITTDDSLVAVGESLTLDATALTSGNSLIFNGSAEVGGDFVILGGAGDDDITAGQGDDRIAAGDGDDIIRMSTNLTSVDVIDGGDGSDTLWFTHSGQPGDDNVLDGITNVETIIIENTPPAPNNRAYIKTVDSLVAAGETVTIDASRLETDRDLDFWGDLESDGYLNVIGSQAGDYIRGGMLADTINGGDGDDELFGMGGDDTLTGGLGNDTFEVTAGNDVITDLETGDILKVSSDGNATANDIAGFVATNSTSNTSTGVVTLNAATGGVTIDMDLADGSRGYTINGNTGNDTLSGSDWADIINGGEGDDQIDGGLGNDLINAGAGNDTVVYSNTDTTVNGVDGGDGIDTIDASASGTGVSIDLSSTTDAYINFENIIGSDFNDALLRGNADNNIITGGAGDDDLDGGAGNDVLFGGTGKDDLWGGMGADTFVFAAGDSGQTVATADVIYDFNAGAGDLIELVDAGAMVNYVIVDGEGANDDVAFAASATGAFTGGGNLDVYVEYDANNGGDAWMAVDMDGNGTFDTNDLFIVLIGVNTDTQLGGQNGSFITTSGFN